MLNEPNQDQTAQTTVSVPQKKTKSKLILWGTVAGVVIVVLAIFLFLNKSIIYEGGQGQLRPRPLDCNSFTTQLACEANGGKCTWETTGIDEQSWSCIPTPSDISPQTPPPPATLYPEGEQPSEPRSSIGAATQPIALPPSSETTAVEPIPLLPTFEKMPFDSGAVATVSPQPPSKAADLIAASPPTSAQIPGPPSLPDLAGPPPTPFDYKIRPIANATVQKGNKISIPITLERSSGTAQPVTLSATTLSPNGSPLQYGLATSPCTPNPTCSASLTIQTNASTLIQSHRIQVIGKPLDKTAEFNLNVLEAPTTASFDFKLSNSGNAEIQKGSNVLSAITVTRIAGTAKPVTLTVIGITPERPYSFISTKNQQATCTPSPDECRESLFIDTKTAEPGEYRVLLNGDPGGKTTQFTIKITGVAATPPALTPPPAATPPAASSEKLSCTITAMPATVIKGQQTTLEIKPSGQDIIAIVLDNTAINDMKGGTKTVIPDVSRSYNGTVKNAKGDIANCSVAVTVLPQEKVFPAPPGVRCSDPSHVYDPVKKVCIPPTITAETKCADPTYTFDPTKKICIPPSQTAETKCADPTYTFDSVKKVCVPPTTTTTTVVETKCADPTYTFDAVKKICIPPSETAETKCADSTYKFDATRKVCVPPTEIVMTKTVTKSADDTGPVEDPTKTTKVITVKEPTYTTPSTTTPSTTTRQPYGTFIQGKTGPGILIYPAGIIFANIGYYFARRRKKNRL